MERKRITEIATLEEGAYSPSTGRLRVRIIQAGVNSSKTRRYPAVMLERDSHIFNGSKMFVNHQTAQERRTRPEGDVRDWVASLEKVVFDKSKDSTYGEAVIIDPEFKKKVELLNEQGKLPEMGISIRAYGKGRDGSDGIHEVGSLLESRSVDFVTFPGAGGRVEALEAAGELAEEDDVNIVDAKTLEERRPDLVTEILESRRETGMTSEEEVKLRADLKAAQEVAESATKTAEETTTKLTEATKLLEEGAKKDKIVSVSKDLEEKLKKSELPDASQDRLREQFKDTEEAEGIDEAIKKEQEYVASLTGKTKPKNVSSMGESKTTNSGTTGDEDKPDLVAKFQKLGLSEESAKVAANHG